MADACTGRPYDDDHSTAQVSYADEARLAIIEALIGKTQGPSRENINRIGKIQAPFGQGLVALGGVEADFHWRSKIVRAAECIRLSYLRYAALIGTTALGLFNFIY